MKRFLTILIFAILLGGSAIAYDFSAVCESGQTLCYNITSNAVPYMVELTSETGYGYNTFPTGDLTIPETVEYNSVTYSVTSIGDYSFYDCSELTSVTIPNSVTSIGYWAFRQCSGLTSVTIGISVTSIGRCAFFGCSGLTSVTIPNSVMSISDGAFIGCSGLTSVTIGNSVTSIGGGAFEQCHNLTSVSIPNSVTEIGEDVFLATGWYFNQPNGILYLDDWYLGYKVNAPVGELTINEGAKGIAGRAFMGCNGLTSVTLPNSVISIGYEAFGGCSGLTSLTIPNSVMSIGYNAFYDCSGLTSVTIPNSVMSIGDGAFYGCSGLTEPIYNATIFAYFPNGYAADYTIPDGIQQICGGAFFGCSGLTSVTIGNSVTSIGGGAFGDCSGLTSVIIPNSVMSIGDDAFSGCCGLTSVTIGNSVTSIGGGAFRDCSGLTSVTIGNSVTSIGSSAFWDCSGLTSVIIPNSVTSIGSYAFFGCSRLEKIYSNAETPATIGEYTFLSTVPIFVPCGAENNYLADEQWGRLNINSELPYRVNVNSADEEMGSAVLLHQYCSSSTAVIEARPKYGYHFVHWNDGNTDNPRTINVTQDTTFNAIFEVGNSIDENNMESKISLFPNPATDILNITSSETISEIEIINTLGQVVYRTEVNTDNAVCDVEGLVSGMYVVRIYGIETASVVCQQKFIKE